MTDLDRILIASLASAGLPMISPSSSWIVVSAHITRSGADPLDSLGAELVGGPGTRSREQSAGLFGDKAEKLLVVGVLRAVSESESRSARVFASASSCTNSMPEVIDGRRDLKDSSSSGEGTIRYRRDCNINTINN